MFEELHNAPRLLMSLILKPVQGDRFQPTGFADLGAAVYERADGKRMLLVESPQSMANRLEHTCLDAGPRLAAALDGLPYVLVRLTGETNTETSSLIEAHRLNSPYIISDPAFQAKFMERSGYAQGTPLNWSQIAAALFWFDPNSLLHGVFMANLADGRIKAPRMLSSFIEAEDIREAGLGGVKNNPIDPTGKLRTKDFDKDVYGNVPYHRTEYTASRLIAYFNFDFSLLKGYGLPPESQQLLTCLGLYKIRRFLSSGLRLRTACDLMLVNQNVSVESPDGWTLPDEASLLRSLKDSIQLCSKNRLFAVPAVTELTRQVIWKKDRRNEESSTQADDLSEDAD
jgi:CRISPR-associated protein Csb1